MALSRGDASQNTRSPSMIGLRPGTLFGVRTRCDIAAATQ